MARSHDITTIFSLIGHDDVDSGSGPPAGGGTVRTEAASDGGPRKSAPRRREAASRRTASATTTRTLKTSMEARSRPRQRHGRPGPDGQPHGAARLLAGALARHGPARVRRPGTPPADLRHSGRTRAAPAGAVSLRPSRHRDRCRLGPESVSGFAPEPATTFTGMPTRRTPIPPPPPPPPAASDTTELQIAHEALGARRRVTAGSGGCVRTGG